MTKKSVISAVKALVADGYTFTLVTSLAYNKTKGPSCEIYPSDNARNGIAQFITAIDFLDDSLAIYYTTQPTTAPRERAEQAAREHITFLGYESIVAVKSGFCTTTRYIDITE